MTTTHDSLPIAEARRTSLGLYVTAKEAYDMWQADPGLKILDVRTPEEFVFVGHAPMSVNVPFALQTYDWDPEKKALRWELNPEFVAAVQAWAAPDEQILVACRSGGRSAMAINMLAKAAGFTRAWNILDGWEGSQVKDPESVFDGMRMKNGWKNSGLPWTYEIDPARMTLPPRQSRTFVAGNEHD
jgi:rhodanese-related sulfurtransferase